jgi:uncharacterized membrane protein (DUF106 family)
MVFDSLLNPVFYPLLDSTGYFWTLLILSFLITWITTLVYKYTTNQSLMKDLKDEQKALQKQVKELKNEPDKAMKAQKRMMEINSKYMMHSFKPMIFTFLPVIIFFGWMNTHLGYYPIMPGSEFSVDVMFNDGVTGNVLLSLPLGMNSSSELNQTILAGKTSWILNGLEGEYILNYNFNGKTYSNKVLISSKKAYYEPITRINKDGVKTINVGLKPVLLLNLYFKHFGWLGTYIIFSIVFSSLLRKLMKIY